MARLVATLLGLGLIAGVAAANGAPPPQPPKGKVVIPVDVSVKLEKEIKGYVVFDTIYAGESRRQVVGTEKAVTIPPNPWLGGGGSRYPVYVYAVPEDLVPKLKDLTAADRDKILTHKFDGQEFADKSDARKLIQRQYVIMGVDPKKGIEVAEVKEDKQPVEKEKDPLALAVPGDLIGGIAAALAVTLGGLWLVRRRK